MFFAANRKKICYFLFTGIGLLVVVVLLFALSKSNSREKKIEYLGNPQAGDVYLVKENKHTDVSWYFLKVAELWEDSIVVYHSSLEYSNAVKELDKEDYFALDEQLIFTKSQLQQMFENGELSKVQRDYSSNDSFNRMKYE